MKKLLCLILTCILSVSLFSCKKNDGPTYKDDLKQYVSDKYSSECNITSTYINKAIKNRFSRIYFTNTSLNGHIAFAQRAYQGDKEIFTDNYSVVKRYDEIVNILSKNLSGIYDDFKIYLNLYQTSDKQIDKKDISTNEILSDGSYGIRACIYIKTNDNFDTRNKKIKMFTDSLKSNGCILNSLYLGFLKNDFNMKNLDSADYTYELNLDSMSRNKKCEKYFVDEYYSFWQKSTQNYNYMKKNQKPVK